MAIQVLVPLHTYPDGNGDGLADHALAVASHLDGALNVLVLGP